MLRAFAQGARKIIRHEDDFGRIGGDEFVVIIDPFDVGVVPADLANRLRACIADPITLPDGESYRASVSVGVAVFPDDGGDATALLTAADAAMYSEKMTHRSR